MAEAHEYYKDILEEEQEEYESDDDVHKPSEKSCCYGKCTKTQCWASAGVSACCSIILFVTLYIVGVGVIGGRYFVLSPKGWGWMEGLTDCSAYWCGANQGPWLTPQNITRYLRWQGVAPDNGSPLNLGYKSDAAIESQSCYSLKQVTDMEAYNNVSGYKHVNMYSRPDPQGLAATVRLGAWAMKTKDARQGTTPPRIVVQHGIGSCENNRYVQYAAWFLRSMGFDVLAPSLRCHGSSECDGNEHTTWGWIYPYDLLGAFDYAVNDPDGYFGGPIDPAKVGILGVSMGAFITSTAFALEPTVGAAWIDSGPSSPKGALRAQFPSWLQWFAMPGAWWGGNYNAGVDLDRYVPKKAIPCYNSTRMRPVAIAGSSADTFVPVAEDVEVAELFASYKECYVVSDLWLPSDKCGGSDHVQEMYLSPDLWRAHVCGFFTKSFNLPCRYCKLEELPWYHHKTQQEKYNAVDAVCDQYDEGFGSER